MNITPEFLQSVYGSRILIVDDVVLNQMMIEKSLRARGFYNISLAGDGQQALDMAKQSPPDMIILDIVMPVMDGFECCRQLRALPRHRDTPILVQTILTEPQMRLKAFSVGATDIVSKPVDPDELYARVMVHLEKQRYLRELQDYYERTSMELDNARALQLAILPDAYDIATMKQRHSLDVAAHFRPSSEVGGDFWGMKKLFPHQVAFWMVDVSNHGVMQGAVDDSAKISDTISRAVIGMQFQDRNSQQIGNAVTVLRQAATHLRNIPGDPAHDEVEIARIADVIAGQFTLSEFRKALIAQLAAQGMIQSTEAATKTAPRVTTDDDIELF